jgi:HK97 family phage prohead protease
MIQSFAFEVKSIAEGGTFEGLASTYNSVDLTGEAVMPGAFTRTLQQGGDERPLLWLHKDPVGTVRLRDSSEGLIATGKLSLAVQQAKDAYTLLRDRAVRGLSIGFTVVKDAFVGEVRQLQEVRLWEVSLTPTPANPAAAITQVKSMNDGVARALASFRSDVERAIRGGK